MNSLICRVCDHEFATAAPDQAGPACPRCGELIGPPGATPSNTGGEVFLSVAFCVSFLGLLALAFIIVRS
jgi:hypothetical protein